MRNLNSIISGGSTVKLVEAGTIRRRMREVKRAEPKIHSDHRDRYTVDRQTASQPALDCTNEVHVQLTKEGEMDVAGSQNNNDYMYSIKSGIEIYM